MPLLDQVQKDMVLAMKARDEARLSTLRMMKTALKKHEVEMCIRDRANPGRSRLFRRLDPLESGSAG